MSRSCSFGWMNENHTGGKANTCLSIGPLSSCLRPTVSWTQAWTHENHLESNYFKKSAGGGGPGGMSTLAQVWTQWLLDSANDVDRQLTGPACRLRRPSDPQIGCSVGTRLCHNRSYTSRCAVTDTISLGGCSLDSGDLSTPPGTISPNSLSTTYLHLASTYAGRA